MLRRYLTPDLATLLFSPEICARTHFQDFYITSIFLSVPKLSSYRLLPLFSPIELLDASQSHINAKKVSGLISLTVSFQKANKKILLKYKGLLLLNECNKSHIVCTWPISSFTSAGQKPLRDWYLLYIPFNYILFPSPPKVVLKEKQIKGDISYI